MHVPQDVGKIAFANTLRGLAAFVVMLAHYCVVFWQYRDVAANLSNATPLPATIATPNALLALKVLDPISLGIFGVALFFLISGFVIPFSFGRTDWRGFLAGRALRIYPTYWVGLCVSLAVISISGAFYGRPFPYSPTVVAINYLPGLRDVFWVAGIDGIIWTLDVEIKFYIVCALGYRLLAAGNQRFLLVPLILSLPVLIVAPMVGALAKAGSLYHGQLYTLCASIQYIDFMCIGVAFNFLYRGLIGFRPFTLVVGLLFLAMCGICWRAGTVPLELMWTYGLAVAVFATAFCFPAVFKSRRVTDFLASISYPLYVVHGVMGYAVLRWTAGAGWPVWLCVAIAVGVAVFVATAIHFAIESRAHAVGRTVAARFSRCP